MMFYLIGFVVALSSIFGLTHSQLAREKLQLQRFYEWSYAFLQEQLQIYDLLGTQQHYDTLENNSEQPEELEIGYEEIKASESREQIEGISVKEESNIQIMLEGNEEENEESVAEDADEVLEAITASIRKLSSAANSGRINGSQLYDILLRETLLHNRAVRPDDESPGLILEELSEEQAQEQQQCSGNNNALQNKRKMYFGEEPLEYLPQQQQQQQQTSSDVK